MIKSFVILYAGNIDFADKGFGCTPANERNYKKELFMEQLRLFAEDVIPAFRVCITQDTLKLPTFSHLHAGDHRSQACSFHHISDTNLDGV
jgi:hypothetical protein